MKVAKSAQSCLFGARFQIPPDSTLGSIDADCDGSNRSGRAHDHEVRLGAALLIRHVLVEARAAHARRLNVRDLSDQYSIPPSSEANRSRDTHTGSPTPHTGVRVTIGVGASRFGSSVLMGRA